MKKANLCHIKHLTIGVVIILIIGIFIGTALPFQLFSLLIQNINTQEPVSIPEAIDSVVGVIQSILTFGVFVVALFGEPIRRFFNSPKLRIELDNQFQEHLEDPKASDRKASKYSRCISVYNDGRASAEQCEVLIEKINFSPNGGGTTASLPILKEEHSVEWINNFFGSAIQIASNSKKRFFCVELYAPDNSIVPGGNSSSLPPAQLSIGGFEVPQEYLGGEWTVDILITSSSDKAYRKQLIIKWDGIWQNRLTDLTGLEVELKDI